MKTKDEEKTREQLIDELAELRKKVAELQVFKSEQNRVLAALRENEENFRTLTENAVDGILIATGEGATVYANKRIAEIMGYSVAELLRTSIKDLAHPDESEKIIERYRKRLGGKSVPRQYETTVVRKDGKSVPIELAAAKTIWQGQPADLVFLRDITERKQMEEVLQFTRFSLDNTADTMVCVDHEARFVDVNDAFCSSAGYSREELLSMTVYDIDPDYSAEIWPEFWRKLKQSGSLIFESCHRTKEGKVFPVEIIANFFEYNGKEYHCSVARDITERKRAEKEIQNLAKFPSENPNPVLRIARDGTLLYMNEAGLSLLPEWHLQVGQVINPPMLREVAFQAMDNGSTQVLDLEHGERVYSFFVGPVVDAGYTNLYGRDITERKQAEGALRESEERYRNLVESISDVVYAIDSSGVLSYISPVVKNTLGYEPDELIGRQFLEFVHKEDQDLLMRRFSELSEGIVRHSDYRLIGKHGDIKWVRTLTNPIIEEGGFAGARGVLIDITERKRVEEEVWRHNEELAALNAIAIMVNSSLDLRQILDQTLDKVLEITKMEVGSLYLIDPQTEELVLSAYRGVSKEFADQVRTFKLGESIVGLAAQSGKPIVADDLTRDPRATTTLVSGEGIRSLAAIPMKSKNKVRGMINMASYTCHPFTNEEIDFYTAIANQIGVAIENARLYEAVQRELTERKQTEEALQFTRFSLDHAADTMVCVGHDGRFIDVNDAFCRSSGYSREELLSMTVHDIDPDYSAEIWLEFWEKLKQSGSLTFESCHRTKEGKVFPVEITANFFEYNGKEYHCSFARDITERKRIEKLLMESERKLRLITENMRDTVFAYDMERRLQYVNPAFEILTGYTCQELCERNFINYIHPEDKARMLQLWEELFHGKAIVDEGFRIITKEGRTKWCSSSWGPLFDEKRKQVGVQGRETDITERKQAEKALRRAEENFRGSLDDSPLGVRIVTTEGETVYANRAILEIYGYDSIEELRTTPVKKRYTPESYAEFQIRKKKRQQGEYDPPEYEISIVRKNGEVRHIEVFRKEVVWGDERQFQVIYLDITERKWAEEALQATKELFEKTFSSQRDAIFLLDAINPPTILDCNPAATELFGYTRQEMVDRTMDFLHVDETAQKEFQGQLHSTLFERGFLHQFKFRMKRKNGAIFHTEHSVTQLKDEQDKGIGWVSVVRDITERKQAEEKLAEREMFNFALFEYNPIETIVVDLEGKVTGFNLAKKKSGDRLPNIGDVMYKDYAGKYENDMYTELMECIRSGEIREFPEQKYGNKVLSITISPFFKGAVIISQDITERKWSEERILTYQEQLRSLTSELLLIEERERRHIATELHDNISQTLAITKIKLGMAQGLTSSTDWVGSLNEIGELVDQAIQYTRSLTFELSPPILYELGFEAAAEWLTEQIQEQHHIEIGFEDDLRSKPMSEEIRIAFFKATKELLINIVKHAQASKAKVSIWREDNSIRIRVEDDGVGFSTSEGKALGKTTGFGLFNIGERIKYLGGDMVIESEPGRGTRVTLSGPLEEE